jgi:3-isopropylmalate/(R)-2-methylmalate dehydratase small subunit
MGFVSGGCQLSARDELLIAESWQPTMDPFTRHTGLVAPLDRVDVDTDQIIPKQFLKSIARTGFEAGLFFDWRILPDGSPNPDFVLNKPQYQGASILVSGRNFGSGSSREHAPWALQQAGFRAVIAPSFGDIFRNNCYQNGLLPVALPENIVRRLLDQAESQPGYRLTIDLDHQTVADERDALASFDIDPAVKHRILNGLDDIGLTLQQAQVIDAFERRRPTYLPRTEVPA